jgi:hypothetical protein
MYIHTLKYTYIYSNIYVKKIGGTCLEGGEVEAAVPDARVQERARELPSPLGVRPSNLVTSPLSVPVICSPISTTCGTNLGAQKNILGGDRGNCPPRVGCELAACSSGVLRVSSEHDESPRPKSGRLFGESRRT